MSFRSCLPRPAFFVPLALLFLSACDTSSPSTTDAQSDDPRRFLPVVLSEVDGADLGPLIGSDPADVVAFAYDAAQSRFDQIPVQVDERFVYDLAAAYESIEGCPRLPDGGFGEGCDNLDGHVVTLHYADASTLVGPDRNPTLDRNDEVALLLSDFGGASDDHPAGVEPETRLEVAVPFGGTMHYAYLYRRASDDLDSAAGVDYVRNDFNLLRGTLASYDVAGIQPNTVVPPPDLTASNPERTAITGQAYSVAFSDRWIMKDLRLGAPGRQSADVLEIDMIRYSGTERTCERTPFSASLGEGAVLVNRDGPVRAIRRVVGFNSGPLTEMTWTFYPYTMETDVIFRVHPTQRAFSSFLDLSDAVTLHAYDAGMIDAPNETWQTMTLPGAGGWAIRSRVDTDIDLVAEPVLFYEDDPSVLNCPAENAYHRAAHGMQIPDQALPNTDPSGGPARDLAFRRSFAFGPDPARALDALQAPLTVQTAY